MAGIRVQRKTDKATAYRIPPLTRLTLERLVGQDNPNGGTEWKTRGMMGDRNYLLIYDNGQMDLMIQDDFKDYFEEV